MGSMIIPRDGQNSRGRGGLRRFAQTRRGGSGGGGISASMVLRAGGIVGGSVRLGKPTVASKAEPAKVIKAEAVAVDVPKAETVPEEAKSGNGLTETEERLAEYLGIAEEMVNPESAEKNAEVATVPGGDKPEREELNLTGLSEAPVTVAGKRRKRRGRKGRNEASMASGEPAGQE